MNIDLRSQPALTSSRTKEDRVSVTDRLMRIESTPRFAMVVQLDVLAILKAYAKPRKLGAIVKGEVVAGKPLADIRWYLTNENGGELLAAVCGLEKWKLYKSRTLLLLQHAELINPHLTTFDTNYYKRLESSTLIDDDTFNDIILSMSKQSLSPTIQNEHPKRETIYFSFFDTCLTSKIKHRSNAYKRVKPELTPSHYIQSELFNDFTFLTN